MDRECFSTVPSYLDPACELLYDIEEPSLSSLDESITSCQDTCHPVKEDSYSDGEAIRNIMTSTQLKRNDQRRSVSLVDVSKIEAFTSRPLGNMLASWETIGSQSSVGKSRDSGYVHSNSLLSVNSAKLSEVKGGSGQVTTILEECTRLKRELEYSEVLINTLQESNNELRMKCAAAHNRISELRLKCVNHCDCCSQQYSRGTPKRSALDDSVFLDSDSGSSSDSSCSPAPESSPHLCNRFNHKGNTFHPSSSKVEGFLKSEEESYSEDSVENSYRVRSGLSRNLTDRVSHSTIKKSRTGAGESSHQMNKNQDSTKEIQRPFQNPNLPKDVYYITTTEDESSFEKNEESPVNLKNKQLKTIEVWENDIETKEIFSKSKDFESSADMFFQTLNTQEKEVEPSKEEESLKKSQFNSIEDLLTSVVDEEKELPKDKVVFLANKVNGKICVGNFQVWGDASVRVAPKSPLLTQPSSTIKVRSVTPSFKNLNLDQMRSGTKGVKDVILPVRSNLELRVSVTSPSVNTVRPISVYSSFPNSPNISRSKQISLSNHSLNNQDCDTPYRPVSQNTFRYVASKRESLNITVTSKSDRSNSQDHSAPKKSNSGLLFEEPKNSWKHRSFNSINRVDSSSTKSPLASSQMNSCQENLSNLGVSVNKKDSKTLCPDSLVDGWKSWKSKLEKISLGYLLSRDSSEKLKLEAKGPKPVNFAGKNSSQTKESLVRVSDNDSLSCSSSTPCDFIKKENGPPYNSENMQECLDKATELVKELSKGIARLPPRLEYIEGIGKP